MLTDRCPLSRLHAGRPLSAPDSLALFILLHTRTLQCLSLAQPQAHHHKLTLLRSHANCELWCGVADVKLLLVVRDMWYGKLP